MHNYGFEEGLDYYCTPVGSMMRSPSNSSSLLDAKTSISGPEVGCVLFRHPLTVVPRITFQSPPRASFSFSSLEKKLVCIEWKTQKNLDRAA
jgi:hypothetical protein